MLFGFTDGVNRLDGQFSGGRHCSYFFERIGYGASQRLLLSILWSGIRELRRVYPRRTRFRQGRQYRTNFRNVIGCELKITVYTVAHENLLTTV